MQKDLIHKKNDNEALILSMSVLEKAINDFQDSFSEEQKKQLNEIKYYCAIMHGHCIENIETINKELKGAKKPNIKEIADSLKLSAILVRKVLDGKGNDLGISKHTQDKVFEAAKNA